MINSHVLHLFLIAIIIGIIQAQSWEGTYTADSSCNTTVCCCLNGKITVTTATSSSYSYSVSSGLTGFNCSNTTFTGAAFTNGYTGWMMVGNSNDSLTLSNDSQILTVVSPTPACSNKGLKNNSVSRYINARMLLVLVLTGMIINRMK